MTSQPSLVNVNKSYETTTDDQLEGICVHRFITSYSEAEWFCRPPLLLILRNPNSASALVHSLPEQSPKSKQGQNMHEGKRHEMYVMNDGFLGDGIVEWCTSGRGRGLSQFLLKF